MRQSTIVSVVREPLCYSAAQFVIFMPIHSEGRGTLTMFSVSAASFFLLFKLASVSRADAPLGETPLGLLVQGKQSRIKECEISLDLILSCFPLTSTREINCETCRLHFALDT